MSARTILVASDLTESSQAAAERALLIARQLGARLELLHVLEAPDECWTPAPPAALLSDMQEAARASLRRLAERLSPAAGETPGVAVTCGRDFVEIIRHARHIGAELVVAGSRGSHPLRWFLPGAMVEKLVRKGDVPVLAVKRPAMAPYRRVLVPVDFSAGAERALGLARRIAPQARLEIVHVYELWGGAHLALDGDREQMLTRYHLQARTAIEQQLAGLLERVGLSEAEVGRRIVHGHPATMVAEIAQDPGYDLVALGTRGRTGLPHLLLGSVAEQVMRAAACDVLMVRPAGFRFELP